MVSQPVLGAAHLDLFVHVGTLAEECHDHPNDSVHGSALSLGKNSSDEQVVV